MIFDVDLLQRFLATNNQAIRATVLRVKQITPSKQIKRGLQFDFRRHQKKQSYLF